MYAGFVFVLLVPFLLFVEVHEGTTTYFGRGLSFAGAGRVLGTTRQEFQRPRFELAPEPTVAVGVLWAAGIGDRTRAELEDRFRLLDPRPTGERKFMYDLADMSNDNLAAIVRHEQVEDTDFIDRERAFAAPSEPEPTRSQVIAHWVLGLWMRVVHPGNVIAWLYYLFLSMPYAAITVLLAERVRALPVRSLPGELPLVLAGCALGGLSNYVLLREPLYARVPDAAVVAPILGVWLASRIGRWRATEATPSNRWATVMGLWAGQSPCWWS